MSDMLLYCIGATLASTVVCGGLASVWAKSRSPYWFTLSMAVAWAVVSTLPLSQSSRETARFPADPAHFVATLTWIAPFVLAGLVGLTWLVKAGASRRKILLVSLAASIFAVPVSLVSGLYAACSLGNCV